MKKDRSKDGNNLANIMDGDAPQGWTEENLRFGVRSVTNETTGETRDQIVSVHDDGIIIFPAIERWRPTDGRVIPCYLLIHQVGGKNIGHAIPRETEDARRHREISPPHNNIKLTPLKRDDSGGLSGFATTGNGKRIIVPKGSGIRISDEEIKNKTLIGLMVEEYLSAFVARCRIPEQSAQSMLLGTDDNSVTALERRVEVIGLEPEYQRYWVHMDGKYYNALEELSFTGNPANKREVKNAYLRRAKKLHPDTRIAKAKLMTGGTISAEREAEIQLQFKILRASYDRLVLLNNREKMANRYAQAGANALGTNIATDAITDGGGVLDIMLGDLRVDQSRQSFAEDFANGEGEELVNRGLEAIGYPGVTAEAELSRNVAVTLAGWLVEERAKRNAEAATKVTEAKPVAAAERLNTPPFGVKTVKKARKPAATPKKKTVAASAAK